MKPCKIMHHNHGKNRLNVAVDPNKNVWMAVIFKFFAENKLFFRLHSPNCVWRITHICFAEVCYLLPVTNALLSLQCECVCQLLSALSHTTTASDCQTPSGNVQISSTTESSFQTKVFRQTFLQHCSAICLELSANICAELWLSDII